MIGIPAAGELARRTQSRRVRAPAESPRAAVTAAVSMRGKQPLPPLAPSQLAKLSARQSGTLLGEAATRIREEATSRAGRWLRPFDRLHQSGRRVRQEAWDALAAIAEPMLARLDLATMVLGWLDTKTGEFRLNRQRGLAIDAGISEPALSRLLKLLDRAGYTRRKAFRMFRDGKAWITRVLVVIRPRFFIELGLGHLLAKAREKKKARRERVLADFARRAQQSALQDLATAQAKRETRRQAAGHERRRQEQQDQHRAQQSAVAQAGDLLAFTQQHPDLSHAEAVALWRSLRSS
ncbi:hypothetical protein [Pseudomonas oryzihabitans]|uniref:hypothetical protein n=1 Tax=Pseudomonas oryzihabitans TaxID=47885 RepID=UPI0011A94733|nr:hypothetical protein [Pseudomonas oryzihabitans]